MPKTEEYKDSRGKNRIRHTADNGNITHASTQGYHNLQDMQDSTVKAAIGILEYYSDKNVITGEQYAQILELVRLK